jgi:uncharacterized membrane protein YhaH (DUF805 family)
VAKPPRTCAGCGKVLRWGRGTRVSVWESEDVETWVCSAECRAAYAAGERRQAVPVARAAPAEERPQRLAAVAILGVTALVELARAAAEVWLSDPLGMVAPFWVHVANALLLVVSAVILHARRRHAAGLALGVSVVVAVPHCLVALQSADARPLLLVASFVLPLFLVLVGGARPSRLPPALALVLLLPAFVVWRGAGLVAESSRAAARIRAAILPGDTAGGSPGSVRAKLPRGWRVLRSPNGILDWPHAELAVIEPRSGANAFLVYNPDCGVDGLPVLQGRSIDALAAAGADPVVSALSRRGNRTVELQVRVLAGGGRVQAYDFFRALPGGGAEPGCVWLHCQAPSGREQRVRRDCLELVSRVERVPEA